MFGGFKDFEANFTPAPNQFWDCVVGHYPNRVVTVVAILIRSTLGWRDPVTKEKRVEAELPLSAFIRPELCKNSARQGLEEAIAAGFIVLTAAHTNRDGARYALRWEDPAAQEEAIQRARRATNDAIITRPRTLISGDPKNGSPKVGSPIIGAPESAPPLKEKKDSLGKERRSSKKQTFNVTQEINFVDGEEELTGVFSAARDAEVQALVTELEDRGSERRHYQLLAICDENGLSDLPRRALLATRERLAKQGRRGPVQRPGAYYQRILIGFLEDHQVFVPKAGDEDPDEVRRLARASLGFADSE